MIRFLHNYEIEFNFNFLLFFFLHKSHNSIGKDNYCHINERKNKWTFMIIHNMHNLINISNRYFRIFRLFKFWIGISQRDKFLPIHHVLLLTINSFIIYMIIWNTFNSINNDLLIKSLSCINNIKAFIKMIILIKFDNFKLLYCVL